MSYQSFKDVAKKLPALKVPDWILPLYLENYTFYVLYGGRNAAKSYCTADFMLVASLMNKNISLLCARQIQKSIDASVHRLLEVRIDELGLNEYFAITKTHIIAKPTRSVLYFAGLLRNTSSLKSIPNLKFVWIEEADSTTYQSWTDLIPTLTRNEGCKIICTLNPKNKTDFIYNKFILNEPPPSSYVRKVTYRDNPFPINDKEIELMEHMRQSDYSEYLHVYEGECKSNSSAQILRGKWSVENFEIDMSQNFYLGLDFGYSVDPTAAIACYIKEDKLFIAYEAGGIQLDIDDLGSHCERRIPMFKRGRIYADSASPGNIAYLVKHGYNVHPAIKKQGSVEDGIAFLRSFDQIVIHSSCEETAKEAHLYSYKVDPHSELVTTKIVDADNHYIDATRYALNKLIYKKQTKWEAYSKYARFSSNNMEAMI